jgi:NAD(P)-dependent dehydrogenase (short-subunit alcohol dehydrogenase family)
MQLQKQLIQRIVSSGHPAPTYVHCNLAHIDVLQQAIEKILASLGTVDILVNNAANDTRHSIEEVTSESWGQSFAVNLKPQFSLRRGLSRQ